MSTSVLATKLGMTQAWTTQGKRLAVTRCQLGAMSVVGHQDTKNDSPVLEIGYGPKKLKNVPKPLRSRLEKGGFSLGMKEIRGLRWQAEDGVETPAIGATIPSETYLTVGDVVQVQGVSKGRGFASAIKRHGFAGGPKTHGQSDRQRAVGSIGAGTIPGRVFKGKRMPGHYGTETKTVSGLVVIYVDPMTKEVWLNGPVPGFASSTLTIQKTGGTRSVELDLTASGIKPAVVEEPVTETPVEVADQAAPEVAETPAPVEEKIEEAAQ